MTEREKTDIEFDKMLAQFDKTLAIIKAFNEVLRVEINETLVEIAEEIANGKSL
jgi:truncated hemoglobin YjbI